MPANEVEGSKKSEARKKTPKRLLAVASIVRIAFSVMPWTHDLPQSILISALFLSIAMGFLVAVGIVEDVLVSRNYLEFEGFKYAWGLFAVLVTYLARITGLDDVNAIFHIDPGLLPMTVWAATALQLAVWLCYASLVAGSRLHSTCGRSSRLEGKIPRQGRGSSQACRCLYRKGSSLGCAAMMARLSAAPP